ncbi:MinD/ParA family protein [Thermosynechococcaceae cyanobacterium Okahandja]
MGNIISVHSFRGGTGKSNTTANIGCSLATLGYRVGIVDTDIQSPGIHVLFGLESEDTEHALNDYLWGRCEITDVARDVTHLLTSHNQPDKGAIFLIPSSLKTSEITRVLREGYDVGLLNDGFQQLLQGLDLDFLMIDTHPGLNEETLLSITVSDALVLILRPDRQDFQGTAVTVDVARQLDVPKMVLVANKVPAAFNRDSLKQQIESTYSVPVAGVLPVCEEMFQLGSSDIFCLRYPDHPYSLVIRSIVQHLLD